MSANARSNSRQTAPVVSTIEEVAEAPAAEIFLQPIAAPSILGLYGFAGATFMVAAYLAHWFGSATTPFVLLPFAAIFGGLAQFTASMWAFKARDSIAVAMHGLWGSFWIAYGILNLLYATRVIPTPPGGMSQGLGFWFIVLAVITATGAYAATAENKALTSVLVFLALGSIAAALGNLLASSGLVALAGWLFFISAVCAWYTASALMFKGAFGRDVLPLGLTAHAKTRPVASPGLGEPGVLHGQ